MSSKSSSAPVVDVCSDDEAAEQTKCVGRKEEPQQQQLQPFSITSSFSSSAVPQQERIHVSRDQEGEDRRDGVVVCPSESSDESSSPSSSSEPVVVEEEPAVMPQQQERPPLPPTSTRLSPKKARKNVAPPRIHRRQVSAPVFSSSIISGYSRNTDDEDEGNNSDGCDCSGSKKVRFGGLLVRSYSQILGDHPCCSTGIPLSLGWDYKEAPEIKVEEYEAITSTSESLKGSELRLSWEERRARLSDMSDEYIKRHCRQWQREQQKICSIKQQTSQQRRVQETFFGRGPSDEVAAVITPSTTM